MLTRELVRRLSRNTATREIDTAPVEVLKELLECANEALGEVSARMHPGQRRVSVTVALRPPTSLEAGPTAGSQALGNAYPAWVGRAIQLPGDATPNRLVGESTLVRAHAGATGWGTGLAWDDCVALPEGTEIVGSKMILEHGGQQSEITEWSTPSYLWAHTITHGGLMWDQMTVSPAVPQHYAVRQVGETSAGFAFAQEPGTWLHVLPWPASACRLHMTLSRHSAPLTMRDYERNTPVMVPAAAEPALIRLAEESLLSTRLYVGPDELVGKISRAAETARANLRLVTATYSSTPTPARVGTPLGW